jgi:hypothetical protein
LSGRWRSSCGSRAPSPRPPTRQPPAVASAGGGRVLSLDLSASSNVPLSLRRLARRSAAPRRPHPDRGGAGFRTRRKMPPRAGRGAADFSATPIGREAPGEVEPLWKLGARVPSMAGRLGAGGGPFHAFRNAASVSFYLLRLRQAWLHQEEARPRRASMSRITTSRRPVSTHPSSRSAWRAFAAAPREHPVKPASSSWERGGSSATAEADLGVPSIAESSPKGRPAPESRAALPFPPA